MILNKIFLYINKFAIKPKKMIWRTKSFALYFSLLYLTLDVKTRHIQIIILLQQQFLWGRILFNISFLLTY